MSHPALKSPVCRSVPAGGAASRRPGDHRLPDRHRPSKVAQADGAFHEAATGSKINWRKFESGAEVIAAVARAMCRLAISAPTRNIAAPPAVACRFKPFW